MLELVRDSLVVAIVIEGKPHILERLLRVPVLRTVVVAQPSRQETPHDCCNACLVVDCRHYVGKPFLVSVEARVAALKLRL
jgi:hypothetical protein